MSHQRSASGASSTSSIDTADVSSTTTGGGDESSALSHTPLDSDASPGVISAPPAMAMATADIDGEGGAGIDYEADAAEAPDVAADLSMLFGSHIERPSQPADDEDDDVGAASRTPNRRRDSGDFRLHDTGDRPVEIDPEDIHDDDDDDGSSSSSSSDDSFSVEAFSDVGLGDTVSSTGGGGSSTTYDPTPGDLGALRRALERTAIGQVSSKVERGEVGLSSAASFRARKSGAVGQIDADAAGGPARTTVTAAQRLWRVARRLRLLLRFCLRLTAVSLNPTFHPIAKLVGYISHHPTDRHADILAGVFAACVDPSPPPLTSPSGAGRQPEPEAEDPSSFGVEQLDQTQEPLIRSKTATLEASTGGGGGAERHESLATSMKQSTRVAAALLKQDDPAVPDVANDTGSATPDDNNTHQHRHHHRSAELTAVLTAARSVAAEACRSPTAMALLRSSLRRLRLAAINNQEDEDDDEDPPPTAVPSTDLTLVFHHLVSALTHIAMLGGVATVRAAGLEQELALCLRVWPVPAGHALVDILQAVQRHAAKFSKAQRRRRRRAATSPTPADAQSSPRSAASEARMAELLLSADGNRPAAMPIAAVESLYEMAADPLRAPPRACAGPRGSGGGSFAVMSSSTNTDSRDDQHARATREQVSMVLSTIVDQWSVNFSSSSHPGGGSSGSRTSGDRSSATSTPSSSPSRASPAAATRLGRRSSTNTNVTAASGATDFATSMDAKPQPTKPTADMPFVAHIKLLYAMAECAYQHAVADAAAAAAADDERPLTSGRGHHRVSFVMAAKPGSTAAAQTLTEEAAQKSLQQPYLPSPSTVQITQALEAASLLPEGSYWAHVPPPQSLISRLLDVLIWWPTADPTGQTAAFLLLQLPPSTFFADALSRKAPGLGSLLASNFVPATAAVTLLRSVSAIVASEAPGIETFGKQLSAPSGALRSRVLQALSVYSSVEDILTQSATALAGMIRSSDQVVPGEPAALARTAKDADSAQVVDAAVSAIVTAASAKAFGGWSAVSSDCSANDVPLVPAFAKAMLAAGDDRATLERVLAAMADASEAAPPADVMGDPAIVGQLVAMAAAATDKPGHQIKLLRCAASAAAQAPVKFGPPPESLADLAAIVTKAAGPTAGAVIATAASLTRHSPWRRLLTCDGLIGAFLGGLSSCRGRDEALPVLDLLCSGGDDSAWIAALRVTEAGNRAILFASATTLAVPATCRVAALIALSAEPGAESILRSNPVVTHALETELAARERADGSNPLSAGEQAAVEKLRDAVRDIDDAANRQVSELRELVEDLAKQRDAAKAEAEAAKAEAAAAFAKGRNEGAQEARDAAEREKAETSAAMELEASVLRDDLAAARQTLAEREAALALSAAEHHEQSVHIGNAATTEVDEATARRVLEQDWATAALRLRDLAGKATLQQSVRSAVAGIEASSKIAAALSDVQLDESARRIADLFGAESAAFEAIRAEASAVLRQADASGVRSQSLALVIASAAAATSSSSDSSFFQRLLDDGVSGPLLRDFESACTQTFDDAVVAVQRHADATDASVLAYTGDVQSEEAAARDALRGEEYRSFTFGIEALTVVALDETSARAALDAEDERVLRTQLEHEFELATLRRQLRESTLSRDRLIFEFSEEGVARSTAYQSQLEDVAVALAQTHAQLAARFVTAQIMTENRHAAAERDHAAALAQRDADAVAAKAESDEKIATLQSSTHASTAAKVALESDVNFQREQVRTLSDQLAQAQRRVDSLLADQKTVQGRVSRLEKDLSEAQGAAEKAKIDLGGRIQGLTKTNQMVAMQLDDAKAENAAAQRRHEADRQDLKKQIAESRDDVVAQKRVLENERLRHDDTVAGYRAQLDARAKLVEERDNALAVQGTLATEITRLTDENERLEADVRAAKERSKQALQDANKAAAAADLARSELKQQLVKNEMLHVDIQHGVAEAHRLRGEIELLHQHNLIDPDGGGGPSGSSNKAPRGKQHCPPDDSALASPSQGDDGGGGVGGGGGGGGGDRYNRPTRPEVVRVVDVAADLSGHSTVSDLRIDPAAHPKDTYIVKLLASLRATSAMLQSVFAVSERDRQARKDAEHRLAKVTASWSAASRSSTPGTTGQAASTTRRRLDSARREASTSARAPTPGQTATADTDAHDDPLDFDATTDGPRNDSCQRHHSTSNRSAPLSDSTLLYAAKHASRSVAKLTEAVAAQHQHHEHAALADAARKQKPSRHRPKSAAAAPRHDDPTLPNVGPVVAPADAYPVQRPGFELHVGPTTRLSQYQRDADPHLRAFLARRQSSTAAHGSRAKKNDGKQRPASASYKPSSEGAAAAASTGGVLVID